MKTVAVAALIAAALLAGHAGLTAAETARLRYLTSVYFDDKGTGLKLPEGVACDSQGQVVVGDTGNDRLLRFTYQDKTVSGGTEIRVPELTSPSKLQLSSKGDIYALDGRQRRIVQLGSTGELRRVVSFDGAPPPSTIVPKSFAIDAADNVYVLDVYSARILVLAPGGQVQRVLALPADAGFVSDIAVDFSGTVVVLDSIGRRLYAAAKDATAFTPLGGDLSAYVLTLPSSLTASKGAFFIAEGTGGTIVNLGRDGTFLSRQLSAGRTEGSLEHPSQMCINERDDVFLADRDNSRIQVFALIR